MFLRTKKTKTPAKCQLRAAIETSFTEAVRGSSAPTKRGVATNVIDSSTTQAKSTTAAEAILRHAENQSEKKIKFSA